MDLGTVMRIAYVTQWFEPEPNIVKGIAFVQALEAAGHTVTVVTGLPNYPYGAIYPGYRLRLIQEEKIKGVNIVRLPLYPSHDRSTFRRSLNFLSFFLSVFVYLVFRRSRFDLVYVYHPPITVGLAAALARVPFILDVQDLWPDTISATGFKGASKLIGSLGAGCRFVYTRALSIVTQSEGMRRALIERGVPNHKLSVIRNWATTEGRSSPDQVRRKHFTLIYGGNLGPAQEMHHVINAAAILAHRQPDIRIVLYGSGLDEEQLHRQVETMRLTNVRLAGRVSSSDIATEFSRADALLLHLGSDPLFAMTIPSKTQHYLAKGRPIIAAVNGEAAQMLRDSGAALVVHPADPEALASAIMKLAGMPRIERERMGQAGLAYYEQHLSFSRGTRRTLALLEGTHRALAAS
jgi:glycosyltransferase involved in cell wall biosynthesis